VVEDIGELSNPVVDEPGADRGRPDRDRPGSP